MGISFLTKKSEILRKKILNILKPFIVNVVWSPVFIDYMDKDCIDKAYIELNQAYKFLEKFTNISDERITEIYKDIKKNSEKLRVCDKNSIKTSRIYNTSKNICEKILKCAEIILGISTQDLTYEEIEKKLSALKEERIKKQKEKERKIRQSLIVVLSLSLIPLTILFFIITYVDHTFDDVQLVGVTPYAGLNGPTAIKADIAVSNNKLGWGFQKISYELYLYEAGECVEKFDIDKDELSCLFLSFSPFNNRTLNLFTFDFTPNKAYVLKIYVNGTYLDEKLLRGGWR